ncbi:MAG TPA: DUF1127 domain-containing protein [Alphaproteobacteria bacterium]|jgi:uncharacterized protein YjiS (DUF1127 family)
MTPTNGKPFVDEFAVYRAARELRAQAAAALIGKAFSGVKGLVKRHLVEPLRARAQRERQLEELMNMDDHMLRDLGLSRGGIAHAFKHGRDAARGDAEPANSNAPLTKPRAA